MDATVVLERLTALGVKVTPRPNGNLYLEPASVIPPDLVELVRQHKPELLSLLQGAAQREAPRGLEDGLLPWHRDLLAMLSPAAALDLLPCLALGARLTRGEIAAVRCGITGKWCAFCQGVPCRGSVAWE